MAGRWIYLTDDQVMVTSGPAHDPQDRITISEKSTAVIEIRRVIAQEGGGVHLDRVRLGTVAELLAREEQRLRGLALDDAHAENCRG